MHLLAPSASQAAAGRPSPDEPAGAASPSEAAPERASPSVQGPPVPAADPQPGGREAERRLVLVVDDDQAVRETLREVLEESGYRAVTAADGLEALEQLQAGLRPDVILLDLMMPRMNGWVFRLEARRDPELRKIPVVILSAAADPTSASGFLEASAGLLKPVDIEVLLDTIGGLCRGGGGAGDR